MTAPKLKEDLIKRRWEASEDEMLRQVWPSGTVPEILAVLPGRSIGSCGRRAHELGVRCENRQHLAKVVSPVITRDGVPGKACVECLEWKPLEKFSRHETCAGGRRNLCTTCEGRIAYKTNPRKRIETVRRYQRAHPEATRLRAVAGGARWRMRKREQMGAGASVEELHELRALYGGICAYCHERDADTFDHVVPLSRGGLHETANLLPACRPCNSSKKDKLLSEWQAMLAARKESR